MRNGCLPNLGNTYFWKRKSTKEGRIAVKANEAVSSKVKTEEECWKREVATDKLHVQLHAVNKNSGLSEKEGIATEAKKMADEKVDDILALDESLTLINTDKDVKSNEKQTVERGLEKVDINCIHTKQDLTQDQANPRKEAIAPKNDDRNKAKTFDLRGLKGGEKIDSGFDKVKTFVLRGLKGGEKNDSGFKKAKTFDLRGIEVRANTANEFNKVKTFDLREVKVRENTANGFSKVKTFDLRGVKSNGK